VVRNINFIRKFCNNDKAMRFFAFIILITYSWNIHAQNEISGKVFEDTNYDGVINEAIVNGIAGVQVSIFDEGADALQVVTSDVNGLFQFSALQPDVEYRVEFLIPPAISNVFKPTSAGDSNATLVQFVIPGQAVNLGLANPLEFVESNPPVVTPCYVEGASSDVDIVVKFFYNNEGTATLDKTSITESHMAGSLWGLAYDKFEKKLFSSAVLKAHIPLGDRGLDAIYLIDPFSGIANATPWIELTDDLGISVSSMDANPQYIDNVARGLNASPQNDATVFQDAGKVGIGDIEISDDGKTLYVVNLYDKTLYAISTVTKQLVGTYPITQPACANGEARPWAIGKLNDEIFVGMICDGSNSGDPSNLSDNSGLINLSASVYKLVGSDFEEVISFPLDYEPEVPFQS